MYNDTLLTTLDTGSNSNNSISNVKYTKLFIAFINKLEGWKTRCKNLHWAAPNRSIHIYLDEFLVVLSNYQDGLAEGYMGILGQMHPNDVTGIHSSAMNAMDLIREVLNDTVSFYNYIPTESEYKGIASECETFIQMINKYKYLFSLCKD